MIAALPLYSFVDACLGRYLRGDMSNWPPMKRRFFYPPSRFAKAGLKKTATSCGAATAFLSAALGTRRAKIAGRISFILSFCAKRKNSHRQIPFGSSYAGLGAQGAIGFVNAPGFAGGYLLRPGSSDQDKQADVIYASGHAKNRSD
jgi:hypothetical protein